MNGYIDITHDIFQSVKQITNNKVVQSQYFDLLEGARAIEVTNPKLDTGIIPLTKAEVDFNCYSPLSGQQVIGITNKLLRLLMSWLNNSSLPVTVLSCRYVQELVQQYSNSVSRTLVKFGDDDISTILTSVIIGISKFIGVMITIGNAVLFEEEDITTRAMDLNLLNEVLIEDVIAKLEHSIRLVQYTDLSHAQKQMLTNQLNLVLNVNKLPILFNLQIELFQGNPYDFFYKVLSQGLTNIKYLQTVEDWDTFEKMIPEGCFSRYIQAKLNNRNIPGELYSIDQQECFTNFIEVFDQIKTVFDKSTSLRNMEEFMDFLKFDIQLQASKFHVITRGFFQIYLVRDDQSILGSSNHSINWITLKILEHTNLFNTIYLTKNWNLPTNIVTKVEIELEKLSKDIEVFIYQMLLVNGSNRCRQRQLINKNLLMLDSLQVSCENFEVELFRTHKINDKLSDNDDLSLPLTSFVYYHKINSMIDFLLIGIELDLYKLFEIYSVYWYADYLLKMLIDHYYTRIVIFNQYKLAKLTTRKKKSTGANKIEVENKRQVLIQIITHNQQQLRYFQLLQKVISCVVSLLQYYHHKKDNNIEFTAAPKDFLVSFENLFRLRFKSFESIGVPNTLSFDNYQKSLDQNPMELVEISQLFHTVKDELAQFSQQINNANFKVLVDSLTKTCLMYIVQLKSNPPVPHTITISNGYNSYFPKIA